ncbi:MAG: PorT family protein [Muribaculaceae bacterium]|nr:PorT family protein [Muribaculaceae bacterium]
MKTPTIKCLMLCLTFLLASLPAHAQFRLGVKAGLAINHLKFDRNIIKNDNRAGFTAGVTAEFNLPLGFGFDAAVMYTHRNNVLSGSTDTYKRDYIEIPVHLKYKLSIVGLNNVLTPMAFAGPNFAFLAHESRQERWDNRSTVTSLDLGFGVELLRHLQLSACYSMGLSRALKQVGMSSNGEEIDGRDRTWTIAAAYFF